MRSVRKITPIQRPGPSQHIDISVGVKIGENLTTIISSDSQEDQLKLKLQVFYFTPVGNHFEDLSLLTGGMSLGDVILLFRYTIVFLDLISVCKAIFH